jgi:cell division protein FtsB
MPSSLFRKIITSKPVILLEIAVLVFFGFRLGEQILRKRAVEDEIKKLEFEISKLEAEKDEIGKLLEYVKTDNFVKSEAREKLSLVPEGERVVVIPDIDSVFEAQGGGLIAGAEQEKVEIKNPSNIILWWRYFFDYNSLWIQ